MGVSFEFLLKPKIFIEYVLVPPNVWVCVLLLLFDVYIFVFNNVLWYLFMIGNVYVISVCKNWMCGFVYRKELPKLFYVRRKLFFYHFISLARATFLGS